MNEPLSITRHFPVYEVKRHGVTVEFTPHKPTAEIEYFGLDAPKQLIQINENGHNKVLFQRVMK